MKSKNVKPKNKVTFIITVTLILIIAFALLYAIYRGAMGLQSQSNDENIKHTAQVESQKILLELQASESTEKISTPIAEDDVIKVFVTNIFGDNIDKKSGEDRFIVTDKSGLAPELVKKFIGKKNGDTIIYEQKISGKDYDSIKSTIQINGVYKLAPLNNGMVEKYVETTIKNTTNKELLTKLKNIKTPKQLQSFLEDYIYTSLKEQKS